MHVVWVYFWENNEAFFFDCALSRIAHSSEPAIPHGLTVEYMPWTLRLFEETPAIEDGQIVVPQKPGLGLKFDEAALRQFEIS